MKDITNEEIVNAFKNIDTTSYDPRLSQHIAKREEADKIYRYIKRIIETRSDQLDSEDIDKALNIFRNQEQIAILNAAYNRAINESRTKEKIEFKKEKRTNNRKSAIVIASLFATLMIGCGTSNILFPIDNQPSEPVIEETVGYQSFNTGKVNTISYSADEIAEMADDILNYQGNVSYDFVIYSYFIELNKNPLAVKDNMNLLFGYLYQTMNYDINSYDPNLVSTIHYPSFDDYLAANGYSSIAQYKGVMSNMASEQQVYLDNSYGGR